MVLKQAFEGRVSLVCVGNELSGDDGLGKALAEMVSGMGDCDFQVLFTATAPENFTDEIIGFKPEKAVLVDAGDFKGRPGETREVDIGRLQGMHVSTHRAPMKMFANRLRQEGIEVRFIAVQVKQTGLGEPISREVMESVGKLADEIYSIREKN
ncbi:MAG: hydrogenase maturation protease [Candidatus Altiarchaeales archaeon]|nr:hydrogenase maturation protease [Candidatus Altiarchaeales archaeon]MBD3415908.1 hydrogenase maturation protease [Candidatus Altiarchaeales archaeon]